MNCTCNSRGFPGSIFNQIYVINSQDLFSFIRHLKETRNKKCKTVVCYQDFHCTLHKKVLVKINFIVRRSVSNTNVLIWPHKYPASSPPITLKLYKVPLFGKKLRFFWNGCTFDDKRNHWALNSATSEEKPVEHVAPLCSYYQAVICEAYGYFVDFKLCARP